MDARQLVEKYNLSNRSIHGKIVMMDGDDFYVRCLFDDGVFLEFYGSMLDFKNTNYKKFDDVTIKLYCNLYMCQVENMNHYDGF